MPAVEPRDIELVEVSTGSAKSICNGAPYAYTAYQYKLSYTELSVGKGASEPHVHDVQRKRRKQPLNRSSEEEVTY